MSPADTVVRVLILISCFSGMREHELLSTMPSLGYRPSKRGSLQRASSYKRKSMMMLGTISGFLSNSKRRSTIVEIEPPSPVSDGDYCD